MRAECKKAVPAAHFTKRHAVATSAASLGCVPLIKRRPVLDCLHSLRGSLRLRAIDGRKSTSKKPTGNARTALLHGRKHAGALAARSCPAHCGSTTQPHAGGCVECSSLCACCPTLRPRAAKARRQRAPSRITRIVRAAGKRAQTMMNVSRRRRSLASQQPARRPRRPRRTPSAPRLCVQRAGAAASANERTTVVHHPSAICNEMDVTAPRCCA